MNVLVIDDDEVALATMTSMLARYGFSSKQFTSAEEAYQYLIELETPVIIILDWMMEHMDGPTFCELVRNTEIKYQPYIIMMTRKTSDEDEASALEHGADDFMSKPLRQTVFAARLRCAERVVAYQKQLHNQFIDMSRLAMYDPLTGIHNRLAGTTLIRHDLLKMDRNNMGHGFIAMVDIDFFKNINDQYGHDAGDVILKLVTERVSSGLRDSDIFYRHGGEEFIIMSTTADNGVAEFLERIRSLVSEQRYTVGNTSLAVTISIGGIKFNLDDIQAYKEDDEADVLAHLTYLADEQLYKAKQDGRNRVCIDQFR